MASVPNDGGPTSHGHPDHKRKRSLSRSSDPPTAATGDIDSPLDPIRSKRSRPHAQNGITTMTARSPSIESKNPKIIESAVSELRLYFQNRLDKLKERLRVWESNGFVS